MIKLQLVCPNKNLSVRIGYTEAPFDLDKAISTVQLFLQNVGNEQIESEEFKFEDAPFEKLAFRDDLTVKDWSKLFDKFKEIKNNAIGTERTKQIAKTLSAIEFSKLPFSTSIDHVEEIVLNIHPKDTRSRTQFIDDALEAVVAEIQASDLSNVAQDAILHAIDKSKFRTIFLEKHQSLEMIRNWDVVLSKQLDHLEE